MGMTDAVTKEYMRNTEVFADAFNFLMYDGEQVIRPECLRELDTASIALPYGDGDVSEPIQRSRDVLKAAMEDDNGAYLILGVENQTDIHYAMPVRNMLYDAIHYAKQTSDAAKSHRNAHNTGESGEEYLSGFYRNDKLLPVITLVIYFGANRWDASRSIHEMMLIKDERILAFTPDYRINLIAPGELTDEELLKFKTDLRAVLKYIKYSKDKKMLETVIQEDEIFKSVPRTAAEVINAATNSVFTFNERKEPINMCKAIEDMRNESMAIGEAKGRAEGEAKGRAEGEAKGRAEGEAKGRAEGEAKLSEAIKNLMRSLKIDESEAKKLLGLA